MAIGKMKKVEKEQRNNPKRGLAKGGNFEEKKEKMKLLQFQNKKEVKVLKKQKKKVGRPEVISDLVLQELKTCFAVGMTDEKACYFCKVGLTSLYQYQKKHPEFTEEKQILKRSINLQAKVNIAKSVKKGNTEDSKWRLIKKDPEFKSSGGEVGVGIDDGNNKIVVKVILPEIS